MRKLSETVDDMEAYQKLTDFIVEQILWSTDDKLKESREILMRVQRRQLFKCVGKTRPPKDSDAKEKVIGKDKMKHCTSMGRGTFKPPNGSDIKEKIAQVNGLQEYPEGLQHERGDNKGDIVKLDFNKHKYCKSLGLC